MTRLNGSFPIWCYFLSKYGLGLQMVAFSVLPLKRRLFGGYQIDPKILNSMMENLWIPAAAAMCFEAGYSEDDLAQIVVDSAEYFVRGRKR